MSKFPLNRTKFCSTGVPSDVRHNISNKIAKMGGTHEVNLLSDVRFLVVGARSTEKLKFCLRKRDDIQFIEADDVFDMYNKWMNGEPFDLNGYHMPVFKGMKICLSRIQFDDLILKYFQNGEDLAAVQKWILHIVTTNGGEISSSLSMSTDCMVSNDLQGKKFDMTKSWKIPVVHPIWIVHSIKRGLSYEFSDYDMNLDPIDLSENASRIWTELHKRKFREDEQCEVEQKKELTIKRKDPGLWKSVMSISTMNQRNSRKNSEWDDVDGDEEQLKRPNINPFNSVSIPQVSKSWVLNPTKSDVKKESDLFKDKTFLIKFFHQKEQSILRKVIESHNGSVLDADSPNLDYLVIPSDFEAEKVPEHFHDFQIVTEWFIERSLHYSTVQLDQWGKPFYRRLTKSCRFLNHLPTGGLNISITGFQGIELLHITKMINKLMIVSDHSAGQYNAFSLSEKLNKDVDLLIVNIDLVKPTSKNSYLFDRNPSLFKRNYNEKDISSSSMNSSRSKIKFAKAHSIPLVTISFLFEFFLCDREKDLININFKDWCLYCPKLADINPRIKGLIVLFESELETQPEGSNESLHIPPTEPLQSLERQDSLPKLPSPIRNKRNNNSLRLIGRAKVSHLENSTASYDDRQHMLEMESESESGLRATQISYENMVDNNESIMQAGGDISNDGSLKRRATRSVHKQLMDLVSDVQE